MLDPTETEQVEQTQEVTEQTEEVQTEQTEEVQTEQTKETKEESKESFVERWKGVIKDRLSGGEDEGAGDEIPDEFTEAARKMNWSDEETETFAADFTDEQLKEMIPSLLGEVPVKAGESSDKAEETQTETKEEKVEDSQDDEKLKPLLDRIAELEKAQGISAEKSAAEEQASFNQRASDLFDEASKEFEVFGKTDDLPKFPDGRLIPTSPQMKARLEVYGMAQQLKEAGMPGDKALEFSLNAYKGANLKVETQRNVIKDLKKREQTLGGKRVSHEVAATGDLTGPEILQAVARKHGKELPM